MTTGFPLFSRFVKDDLIYIIINILLDLLLLALALWAMHALRYRWENKTPLLEALPTERLFDLQNPLMRILLCVAAIPAGFQLLSRLIYDFSNGLPYDLPDFLWMITYYLSDFAFVIVGYLIIQAIAEDADITLTANEAQAYLTEQLGVADPDEYLQFYGKGFVWQSALLEKVLAYIESNAVLL